MSDQKTPRYLFLSGLTRFALYFAFSIAIFFGVSVLIFVLRGENPEQSAMPDFTGQHYVSIHNDLQRLQLRVSLVTRQYADQTPGIVLSQSIPAGQIIGPHEKLYLVVNQPEPLITMPQLMRMSEEAARASLSRITLEERVYALPIGAISEVINTQAPADTVLAQFPPAGTRVTASTRVYMLVSRRPSPDRPEPEEQPLQEMIGQNVTILSEYLGRSGEDYRIVETREPATDAELGTVYSLRRAGNLVEVGVYYREPEVRYQTGYELLEVDLDEPGLCRGEVVDSAVPERDQEWREIFRTTNHGEDETATVIFFRTGSERVRFSCGDSLVYEDDFEPDDLS
ncbi:MAG: PASTA domain-containing protein [Spirochaetales bacterium]|nr:PASTA domain-containing protein [Leptospiraceae bacterium]MCP5483800.1 PASTA domain-containing protein [Spirochaetales bacterium]